MHPRARLSRLQLSHWARTRRRAPFTLFMQLFLKILFFFSFQEIQPIQVR